MNRDDLKPIRTAVAGYADRFGWRLVVLYGSVARTGTGRDLDLAVLPSQTPDLMTQGRWHRRLEDTLDRPVDLVVLHDGTSPLLRFEIFRDGLCLYEAEPGLFDQEQDRSFFLYVDAQLLLRRNEGPAHGR